MLNRNSVIGYSFQHTAGVYIDLLSCFTINVEFTINKKLSRMTKNLEQIFVVDKIGTGKAKKC